MFEFIAVASFAESYRIRRYIECCRTEFPYYNNDTHDRIGG